MWLFVAFLTAFGAYRGYAAYREWRGERRASGAPPPKASASAGPLHADAGAPVPLDLATRRRMKIGPRHSGSGKLAFGKGRLGQVTADALVVRDISTFRVIVRLYLEAPRNVTALADGSLFCPGAKRTLRLLWHDEKAKGFPMMPLLPGFQIFADRVDSERVWSLSAGGSTLFGFGFGEQMTSLFAPTDFVSLDGFDHRAITSLRDGSILYTTASSYSRLFGKGKKEEIRSSSAEVARLLPGSRPDTVWVIENDRHASLHTVLDGRLVRLQTIDLEADPFDADSAGGLFAVLELAQPSDAPWGFVLEVFETSGKRKFRDTLPAEEALDERWVQKLVENRGIALSSDPPRVAIGGPTALVVFDAAKGAKLFNEP